MEEVRRDSVAFQFKGRGQQETTLITFKGVLKLVMHLPGVNARAMRDKFADILQRYFGGDPTLVKELAENYASEDPVHGFARESAGVPEPEPGESREEAFEGLLGRVLQDIRFKNAIMDELAVAKKEFETQRKRVLYDNRMAEARKVTEHKRKLEQISQETKTEEMKLKIKETDLKTEETKLATEKAVIEACEAKMAASRFDVDCMKEMLELKKVMKEMDAPTPPVPPAETNPPLSVPPPGYNGPITVSRVANFVLRLNDYTPQVRDKALNRAGREAVKLAKPYGGKIPALFGQHENSFQDKEYAIVKKCVEDAFDYERRMSNDITNYLRNGN